MYYKNIKQYRYYPYIVGAKGGEEAAENRNYLAGRMIEEVTETIRVLQVSSIVFLYSIVIKSLNIIVSIFFKGLSNHVLKCNCL